MYVLKRDWFLAVVYIVIWPIKLLFSLRIIGFIRNLRAGRIRLFDRKRKGKKIFTLEKSLAKYQSIINVLSFGTDEQEWLEFRLDGKTVIIHRGEIFYDQTLEELGCPEGSKHSLYALKRVETNDSKVRWEVDQSHNPFMTRLSGHGSTDSYEEDSRGNITHIEQKDNWVS